jgi:hypothetical protein
MGGFEEHQGSTVRLIFDETTHCFKWVQLRNSTFEQSLLEKLNTPTPPRLETR